MVDYVRPADFFPGVNEYRAGSGPVTVTCKVEGPGSGTVSYQWSSTCRNCPFRTATSSVIRRAAVHSGDNGTHTCVVTKGGSTARASIDFLIVGKYMFLNTFKIEYIEELECREFIHCHLINRCWNTNI